MFPWGLEIYGLACSMPPIAHLFGWAGVCFCRSLWCGSDAALARLWRGSGVPLARLWQSTVVPRPRRGSDLILLVEESGAEGEANVDEEDDVDEVIDHHRRDVRRVGRRLVPVEAGRGVEAVVADDEDDEERVVHDEDDDEAVPVLFEARVGRKHAVVRLPRAKVRARVREAVHANTKETPANGTMLLFRRG